MKQRRLEPARTIGWTGIWQDGTIGWLTSTYLSGKRRGGKLRRESLETHQKCYTGSADRFIRCLITVTPLKDRRGRYIVRRGGGEGKR